MIDFRYLHAFSEVAKHQSFKDVARVFRIVTSAVSRQIQILEESCGAQLFFRSPREVRLTAPGKLLYEEVCRFQQSLDHIFDPKVISTLRIGILEGVLENWRTCVASATTF